jgi:hypothetical protein
MLSKEERPKGYTCQSCGRFHEFGVYVQVRWNEKLKHRCECGARYEVMRGKAVPAPTKYAAHGKRRRYG